MSTDGEAARFWLTEAQADVLAREEGPRSSANYLTGSCMSLAESVRMLSQTEECFHTGRGVSYDDSGAGVMCGVCRELAVMTRTQLLPHIRKIPGARHGKRHHPLQCCSHPACNSQACTHTSSGVCRLARSA